MESNIKILLMFHFMVLLAICSRTTGTVWKEMCPHHQAVKEYHRGIIQRPSVASDVDKWDLHGNPSPK
jgi:hypothetical protein